MSQVHHLFITQLQQALPENFELLEVMPIFSPSKCQKPIKETVVQVPKAFVSDVERFTAIEYQ
jgi:hypothetical protein